MEGIRAYFFTKFQASLSELCMIISQRFVVIPTGLTTEAMALKFFPNTNILLKVDC